CTGPAAPYADVPGGTPATPGTHSYAWTCSGSSAGSATLGASVSTTDATDGNRTQTLTPTASVTVAEHPLTATLTGDASTISAGSAPGSPVTLTLQLTNLGSTTANLASISPSVDATNDAQFSCPGVPNEPLGPIGAGGSASYTWACTYEGGGMVGSSSTLSATVSATDAASGGDVSPAVGGWTVGLGM
ncbi:MAG TPA: hypothetical protein VFG59_18195, partial [Anaeromyxobacter sp.]|nr:hypothetical protein [Anaeromyxobacter sp.]